VPQYSQLPHLASLSCCRDSSSAMPVSLRAVVLEDAWMSRISASATRLSCRSVTGIFSLTKATCGTRTVADMIKTHAGLASGGPVHAGAAASHLERQAAGLLVGCQGPEQC
jgi:hypothetical protein